MQVAERSLDDALHVVYDQLMKSGHRISPSRGPAVEIIGASIRISKPRARLSRTESRGRLFSGLGELLWYLAGSNELAFIQYYLSRYHENSDDGVSVHGAYGPRLFCHRGVDQLSEVVSLLRRNPDSRRAVIQLYDANDLVGVHKDIPCTCTIQFMVRSGNLISIVNMRSNDAYLGLPHDVFSFTMLQEIVARMLDVKLGHYLHFVGSLHLYDEHRGQALKFLEEGWQLSIPMPPMPRSDPWPALRKILKIEQALRLSESVDIDSYRLPKYWSDIAHLLEVFAAGGDDLRIIASIKKKMNHKVYDVYVRNRLKARQPSPRGQIDMLDER